MKTQQVQLRLILNREIQEQLDLLARSRRITRLALIRMFLKAKIDEELLSLDAFLQQQESLKATKRKLDKYLHERDY
jgi:antitoxin component of RelBE/YafQ-DinJ toxin-antitoxin module